MSQQISFPPVSGRQLAAYLGISSSQVCMSNSDNYMNRQLGPAQSLKITQLMEAHVLCQQKGTSPSVKKMQKQEGKDCACFADKLKGDALHHSLRIPALKRRLDDMKTKLERDTAWLNTLDRLMAKLPPATKPKSAERIWLEHQGVIVLERLNKNGLLAQMKLELQIELETAKANVYREAYLRYGKQ